MPGKEPEVLYGSTALNTKISCFIRPHSSSICPCAMADIKRFGVDKPSCSVVLTLYCKDRWDYLNEGCLATLVVFPFFPMMSALIEMLCILNTAKNY